MRRQQGSALVEFALVLPLLLILSIVITEMGRAYYQYNTLAKSVREAARFLSVRSPGVDIALAKNIIVYGNPAGGSNVQLAGLSTANIADPIWKAVGTYPAINTVTITVSNFSFTPIVSSVFGIDLPSVVFSPIKATMRSPS
jgi:Flp pilus assembly protein TadG